MNLKKVLYYLLILIFVLFAAVQYNDPDPTIWIILYLIPIYLIYLKMNSNPQRNLYLVIGLLYMLWAINQFPPAWEGLTLNAVGMKTLNIELGRESLGLGFTALIVWVLAFFE
jgi:membrane-bound ClpP family serine protease